MFIEKDDVAMDLMTAGESGSGPGSIAGASLISARAQPPFCWAL